MRSGGTSCKRWPVHSPPHCCELPGSPSYLTSGLELIPQNKPSMECQMCEEAVWSHSCAKRSSTIQILVDPASEVLSLPAVAQRAWRWVRPLRELDCCVLLLLHHRKAVGYARCTAADRRKLQRVIRSAETTIACPLPSPDRHLLLPFQNEGDHPRLPAPDRRHLLCLLRSGWRQRRNRQKKSVCGTEQATPSSLI